MSYHAHSSVIKIIITVTLLITVPSCFRAATVDHKAASSLDVNCSDLPAGVAISLTITEQSNDPEMIRNAFITEGVTTVPGMPLLPAIGRWVRVPERGRIKLAFSISEEERLTGERPELCNLGDDGVSSPALLSVDGIWPPQPVTMGQPTIMRGIRMVPVTYYPLRWDENRDEYVMSRGIEIDISSTGDEGVNEVINSPAKRSHDFDILIDHLLVNPPRRDQGNDYLPGGYLVVANDETPDAVFEFMDWKRRAGHPVDLLTFDPAAVDVAQLKQQIQESYDEAGFEFLVFMGSDDADPPLEIPFENDYYDVFYAQLEGDDPLPDVAVGSFNCIEVDNFTCAIRRAISYQSEPYMEDTEWFTRGAVAVGAVSVPSDLSPSYSGRWFAEIMRRSGFDDVRTSFFADNDINDPSPMVEELYNEGINYMLVRAHQWDLDVDHIRSGDVYPFHFLCSSGTISPPNNGAFNWAFRMGTPDDMRGPSCGFGHNSSPRTNAANALAGGLFESMFMYGVETFGWARNYTVAKLQQVMPEDGANFRAYYYSHWRYYGDPGQWCWRGVPEEIEIGAITELNIESTHFGIGIRDTDGEWLSGAVVTIQQPDGFHFTKSTGRNGHASFIWERGELNEEDILLSVVSQHTLPFQDQIAIEQEPMIVLNDYEIDDSEMGNDDDVPNAGEWIAVVYTFENVTDDDWIGSVVEWSGSPWISVDIDGDRELEIEALQEAQISAYYYIEWDCPDGIVEPIGIGGYNDIPTYFTAGLTIQTTTPVLNIADIVIDGDAVPGSQIELDVQLHNGGHQDLPDVRVRLESQSPFALVFQPDGMYNEIPVDEETGLQGDPFIVNFAEETVPGSMTQFILILSRDGVDNMHLEYPLSIQVGAAGEGDPLGPDSYGYIALDDDDEDVEWAIAPEYDWVEIIPWRENPVFEGEAVNILMGDEDDTTVLIDMPFTFRYHGRDYNQISVCSNGWIAVGDQTHLKNQQNWPIPGYNGAFGMIAPFWDRLRWDSRNDGLYSYYDVEGGRYIIEWSTGVMDENRDRQDNIFEVILYDPENHVTPTGDSQIMFQYHTVNNVQEDNHEANFGATVGVGSPDNKDGLTYTYWHDYPASCAPLQAGRAILWTTILYGDQERATIHGMATRYIDSLGIGNMWVRTDMGFMALTYNEGNYRMRLPLGEYTLTTGGGEFYGEVSEEVILDEPDQEVEINFVLPHAWLELETDTLLVVIDDFHGGPYPQMITLTNTGNELLEITSVSFEYDSLSWPEDWTISVDPDEFEVAAEESLDITLTIADVTEIDTGRYYAELVFEGNFPERISLTLIIDVITGIESGEGIIPADYSLIDPYPNPFNASTTVRFALSHDGDVRLALYDLSGREMTTLVDERYRAGWHQLSIDAAGLPTGIYFLRMEAGMFRDVKRVVLLR